MEVRFVSLLYTKGKQSFVLLFTYEGLYEGLLSTSSCSSREPSRQYTLTPFGAPITVRSLYTMSSSQNLHHTLVSSLSRDTVGYRGVFMEIISLRKSREFF
mmetsp:Transcript_26647/g.25518  ORF Transcript_26647/g.25518 Transcript_26647/m.25518 type:complete len:101 (-) Transcript_26647:1854-2156(-)